jgi:hypothetical protein
MEIMNHNTLFTLNRKLVVCLIRKISLRNHSQLFLSHTCAQSGVRGLEPFLVCPRLRRTLALCTSQTRFRYNVHKEFDIPNECPYIFIIC